MKPHITEEEFATLTSLEWPLDILVKHLSATQVDLFFQGHLRLRNKVTRVLKHVLSGEVVNAITRPPFGWILRRDKYEELLCRRAQQAKDRNPIKRGLLLVDKRDDLVNFIFTYRNSDNVVVKGLLQSAFAVFATGADGVPKTREEIRHKLGFDSDRSLTEWASSSWMDISLQEWSVLEPFQAVLTPLVAEYRVKQLEIVCSKPDPAPLLNQLRNLERGVLDHPDLVKAIEGFVNDRIQELCQLKLQEPQRAAVVEILSGLKPRWSGAYIACQGPEYENYLNPTWLGWIRKSTVRQFGEHWHQFVFLCVVGSACAFFDHSDLLKPVRELDKLVVRRLHKYDWALLEHKASVLLSWLNGLNGLSISTTTDNWDSVRKYLQQYFRDELVLPGCIVNKLTSSLFENDDDFDLEEDDPETGGVDEVKNHPPPESDQSDFLAESPGDKGASRSVAAAEAKEERSAVVSGTEPQQQESSSKTSSKASKQTKRAGAAKGSVKRKRTGTTATKGTAKRKRAVDEDLVERIEGHSKKRRGGDVVVQDCIPSKPVAPVDHGEQDITVTLLDIGSDTSKVMQGVVSCGGKSILTSRTDTEASYGLILDLNKMRDLISSRTLSAIHRVSKESFRASGIDLATVWRPYVHEIYSNKACTLCTRDFFTLDPEEVMVTGIKAKMGAQTDVASDSNTVITLGPNDHWVVPRFLHLVDPSSTSFERDKTGLYLASAFLQVDTVKVVDMDASGTKVDQPLLLSYDLLMCLLVHTVIENKIATPSPYWMFTTPDHFNHLEQHDYAQIIRAALKVDPVQIIPVYESDAALYAVASYLPDTEDDTMVLTIDIGGSTSHAVVKKYNTSTGVCKSFSKMTMPKGLNTAMYRTLYYGCRLVQATNVDLDLFMPQIASSIISVIKKKTVKSSKFGGEFFEQPDSLLSADLWEKMDVCTPAGPVTLEMNFGRLWQALVEHASSIMDILECQELLPDEHQHIQMFVVGSVGSSQWIKKFFECLLRQRLGVHFDKRFSVNQLNVSGSLDDPVYQATTTGMYRIFHSILSGETCEINGAPVKKLTTDTYHRTESIAVRPRGGGWGFVVVKVYEYERLSQNTWVQEIGVSDKIEHIIDFKTGRRHPFPPYGQGHAWIEERLEQDDDLRGPYLTEKCAGENASVSTVYVLARRFEPGESVTSATLHWGSIVINDNERHRIVDHNVLSLSWSNLLACFQGLWQIVDLASAPVRGQASTIKELQRHLAHLNTVLDEGDCEDWDHALVKLLTCMVEHQELDWDAWTKERSAVDYKSVDYVPVLPLGFKEGRHPQCTYEQAYAAYPTRFGLAVNEPKRPTIAGTDRVDWSGTPPGM